MLTYIATQFIDFCTLKEYGVADWISAWNTLDIVSYVAQVCNLMLILYEQTARASKRLVWS
jgi:hypothetical protein